MLGDAISGAIAGVIGVLIYMAFSHFKKKK